jgi:hypothetical protein
LKSILLPAHQSPQVLLPLSLHVDSFYYDDFTINYGCSFVFIPGEATIPLFRINAKARRSRSTTGRPLDIFQRFGALIGGFQE